MKLISLWEPWATLMAIGAKKIETRSWSPAYRGWLAIQASKGGLTKSQLAECIEDDYFSAALRGVHFSPGTIVAVVNLQTCWPTHSIEKAFPGVLTEQEMAFGDYSAGRYGWITNNLFRLPEPIPYKAKQGMNDLSYEVVLELRKQWKTSQMIGAAAGKGEE